MLEIAARQQQARSVGREIGVLALDPGARQPPGVGEGVGLAALGGFGRVGVAAARAEQNYDVVSVVIGHARLCPWVCRRRKWKRPGVARPFRQWRLAFRLLNDDLDATVLRLPDALPALRA